MSLDVTRTDSGRLGINVQVGLGVELKAIVLPGVHSDRRAEVTLYVDPAVVGYDFRLVAEPITGQGDTP